MDSWVYSILPLLSNRVALASCLLGLLWSVSLSSRKAIDIVSYGVSTTTTNPCSIAVLVSASDVASLRSAYLLRITSIALSSLMSLLLLDRIKVGSLGVLLPCMSFPYYSASYWLSSLRVPRSLLNLGSYG